MLIIDIYTHTPNFRHADNRYIYQIPHAYLHLRSNYIIPTDNQIKVLQIVSVTNLHYTK